MRLPETPNRIEHGTTDSTNERAFASLESGSARHGDLHVASFQTAGRGRLGRKWLAREGEGLLASLILKPEAPSPPSVALTMATCLGIHDAVCALGVDARLKWPNDVLVGDAKLCGILVETRGFDSTEPHYVVGFGLNVKQTNFPKEVVEERPGTSLANEGVAVEVDDVLSRVWSAFRNRLARIDDSSQLAGDYAAAARIEGAIRVRHGQEVTSGRLINLTVERGLEIERGDSTVTIPLELVRGVERHDP